MNALENIIRDEITERIGTVPSPTQVHIHVVKFLAEHKIKEEVHKESDASFIDSMKKGAVLDKARKAADKGTRRGTKGKKNQLKPEPSMVSGSSSPTRVTQPAVTTGTSTLTLDEILGEEGTNK